MHKHRGPVRAEHRGAERKRASVHPLHRATHFQNTAGIAGGIANSEFKCSPLSLPPSPFTDLRLHSAGGRATGEEMSSLSLSLFLYFSLSLLRYRPHCRDGGGRTCCCCCENCTTLRIEEYKIFNSARLAAVRVRSQCVLRTRSWLVAAAGCTV